MKNLKEKFIFSKNFLFIVLVCVIVVFISIKLITSKNTTNSFFEDIIDGSNNDIVNIFSPYVEELYDINTKLIDCINSNTIDSKNTVNILNDNILKLDSLKSQVVATVISENNFPDAIPKFLQCIESTKNLYNYCIDALTYENQLSNSEISSEILMLKENCLENYNELSPYGIIVNFPKDSLYFFDNIISYLNTLDKLNKIQSINDNRNSEFIKTLKSTTTSFSAILEDLKPAIERIRSDKRSLDVILNDLNKKEETFLEIKKTFSYSSVPEDCNSYYNSLNNVFKLYSTYLSSMKIAVIYEKSSTSYEDNKKNIDKNYSNAYSKFEDVKTSLDVLVDSL